MAAATKRVGIEGRFYLGLLALFWIATASWLLLASVLPVAAGDWHSVVITSGSMRPAIAPGDVVVAAPFEGGTLSTGTVVVFRDDERGLVTHRVVRRYPDGSYLTGGDSNRAFDSTPLEPDRIVAVGRIVVPMAGLPRVWQLGGETHKLVALVVVLLVVARLARYALSNRHCPWLVEDPRRSPGQRPRRHPVLRRWSAAVVLVVLGLVATGADGAAARFSDTSPNGASSWAAASTFGATWYLNTSGSGDRTSTPLLPLSATAPTATSLPNYDIDRDTFAGLVIAKGDAGGNAGETDPVKHQTWAQSQTSSLTLSGTARLTLWSAVKGFRTGMRGAVWAYLQDCSGDGTSCTTFDSALLDLADWSGGSPTWVSRTWDFGTVSRTIAAGRLLRVKIVVDAASGDGLWLAYDTTGYPSALAVT